VVQVLEHLPEIRARHTVLLKMEEERLKYEDDEANPLPKREQLGGFKMFCLEAGTRF
jgi:hypothetical protein